MGEEYEYRCGPSGKWRIVVANSKELRESAFKLVYEIYLSKGYNVRSASGSGVWCTIHSFHPKTVIFLALEGRQPIGTVSVIPDSQLGLPSDIIFPENVQKLRNEEKRLCEVSALVVDEKVSGGSLELLMHFFRLTYITSYCILQCTDVVCTFMAHHAMFYERVLLFDSVSPEVKMSPRTGQPVMFGWINLKTMKAHYKERYEYVYGRRNLYKWFFENDEEDRMCAWILAGRKSMDRDEVEYFGFHRTNILSQMDPHKVAVLMEYINTASSDTV